MDGTASQPSMAVCGSLCSFITLIISGGGSAVLNFIRLPSADDLICESVFSEVSTNTF